MNRASWHLRTNAIVVAWLVAVVVVSLIHPFLTESGWLLVHLLALGALSNAILIWSWHFTAALVRLSDDVMRQGQARGWRCSTPAPWPCWPGCSCAIWPVTAPAADGGGRAGWHAIALLAADARGLAVPIPSHGPLLRGRRCATTCGGGTRSAADPRPDRGRRADRAGPRAAEHPGLDRPDGHRHARHAVADDAAHAHRRSGRTGSAPDVARAARRSGPRDHGRTLGERCC